MRAHQAEFDLLAGWPGVPKDTDTCDTNGALLRTQEFGLANGQSRAMVESGTVGRRVEELRERGILLFSDEHDGAYADVQERSHREVFLLGSRGHKNWLFRHFLEETGKPPSIKRINEEVAEWRALAGAPDTARRLLEIRSCWCDKQAELLIDLCDERRRAVAVGPNSWEVVPGPVAHFRRHGSMRSLPEPDSAGDVRDFLSFADSLENEDDALLLLTFMVLAFVPIERPILLLSGPPGAGKSTVCRLMQAVIDPSEGLLGADDRAKLPLTFFNHLLVTLDNVWRFTPQQSDECCRATSGGAIHWRKLYTDCDSVTFAFKRPIVISALGPPTFRTDFADRCLNLPLARPKEGHFEAPSWLWASFESARSKLFGGLLNALSRTLGLLETTPRSGLSRMADFHWYGRAAAQALDCSAEDFDDAFTAALARQRGIALEDPLAQALVLFANENCTSEKPWRGTASTLRELLGVIASEHQISKGADWPQSGDALGRRVQVLQEALHSQGIVLERMPKGKHRGLLVRYAS